MERKFISKNLEEKLGKVSVDDEWAHITNLREDQKLIDIQDPLEVKDRTFFLNSEQQKPKTHWEKTKEETRNAMDRAGNTGQYIKYVNAHFEKKKTELNRVKELKKNYEYELGLLQSGDNTKIGFSKESLHKYNKDALKQLKMVLDEERRNTRLHLNKLKSAVYKTENDLQKQDLEIKEIEYHILHIKHKSNEDQKMQKIKDDIMELGKKIDAKSMLEIVDVLETALHEKEKIAR